MVDIKATSRLEKNFELPWATFFYAISTTHCMSVRCPKAAMASEPFGVSNWPNPWSTTPASSR